MQDVSLSLHTVYLKCYIEQSRSFNVFMQLVKIRLYELDLFEIKVSETLLC